jgi:hypothetical protein
MCLHSNGNDLLVAGSLGHLRFIDLPTAEADTKDTNSCISKSWRAHVTTVSRYDNKFFLTGLVETDAKM